MGVAKGILWLALLAAVQSCCLSQQVVAENPKEPTTNPAVVEDNTPTKADDYYGDWLLIDSDPPILLTILPDGTFIQKEDGKEFARGTWTTWMVYERLHINLVRSSGQITTYRIIRRGGKAGLYRRFSGEERLKKGIPGQIVYWKKQAP